MPTINSLSSNTSIDISHNKLGFSSIIPNLKDHNDTPRDTNFIYQPQRLLDKRDILSGKENNPITLSVNDNYEGNNYQWYENRTLLKDATNRTYTIDSLDYEKHNLSNYWVILTNPILPSIQLQRNTITLLIEKNNLPNNDTIDNITKIQSPSANLFTYPNPVAKELHIKYQDIQECTIEITDNNGIVVISKTISKTHSQEDYTLNVESLPPGLYHLQVKAGDIIKTSKMIKQ